MIYLASPYSDPDHNVMENRYYDVRYIVGQLLYQRIHIFSPILHCHPVAVTYDLPKDAKYWQDYNTAFLRKADAVYVACLPGWDDSKGVRQEVHLAWNLNIPVHLVGTTGMISTNPMTVFPK